MVVEEEMDFSSDAESEDEEAAGPTERGDQSSSQDQGVRLQMGWMGGPGRPGKPRARYGSDLEGF